MRSNICSCLQGYTGSCCEKSMVFFSPFNEGYNTLPHKWSPCGSHHVFYVFQRFINVYMDNTFQVCVSQCVWTGADVSVRMSVIVCQVGKDESVTNVSTIQMFLYRHLKAATVFINTCTRNSSQQVSNSYIKDLFVSHDIFTLTLSHETQ